MKNAGARQQLITDTFFPDQNVKNLGTEVFNRVTAPVDWCTARQAQQLTDAAVKPDSLEQDLASGRIESQICSQLEAERQLAKEHQQSRNKERGG